MHFRLPLALLVAFAACQPRTGDNAHNRVAPDNTAVNAEDRKTGAKTPMDQSEGSADIATTAAIRRDVLQAKGLSADADNVKIVTSNGFVTLRGVVEDDAERDTVVAIARRIAGADRVTDELSVSADAPAVDDEPNR